MEELGIPELTSEQIEELCGIAENAARKYVLSKVLPKLIEKLNVTVETEGTKPVDLTVEVEVALSPQAKDVNIEKLVEKSVKEAFKASEDYLRKIK